MGSPEDIGFLVFDVESVADGELVSQVRYPGQDLSPSDAISRYRAELLERNGSDFIPYTHQIPTAVVIAKVRRDFVLDDIVALDAPQYRPHVITDNFWRGWDAYGRPTFVTFNGRGFDIPLMELAAFRYGLSVPHWFSDSGPSYQQARYRYNTLAQLDLQEMLVNFGATRFNGGLNLAAYLLGKPGKMNVQGHMVQDLFDEGKLEEINDYCRCDVLDTYFVFLRSRVLIGELTRQREQEIVGQTKEWLEARADDSPAYTDYLEHWQDWVDPWAGCDNDAAVSNQDVAAESTSS